MRVQHNAIVNLILEFVQSKHTCGCWPTVAAAASCCCCCSAASCAMCCCICSAVISCCCSPGCACVDNLCISDTSRVAQAMRLPSISARTKRRVLFAGAGKRVGIIITGGSSNSLLESRDEGTAAFLKRACKPSSTIENLAQCRQRALTCSWGADAATPWKPEAAAACCGSYAVGCAYCCGCCACCGCWYITAPCKKTNKRIYLIPGSAFRPDAGGLAQQKQAAIYHMYEYSLRAEVSPKLTDLRHAAEV